MKLNTRRTVLVGLAFMSICSFWQVYEGIIPLILKDTFHIGDTVSGAVMALDNVLALFLLPLFGALSDKTHTRIGKRMPYILVGTGVAVFSMLLIPIANQTKNLSLFVVGLGITLLAMGSYRSPAVALMPDVTPKPLRSRGNAIINLMGAVGGILMLGAVALLVPKSEHPNYLPLFLLTAVVMVVCVIVLFFTVNEPKAVSEMPLEEGPSVEEGPAPAKKLEAPVRRSLFFILASVFLWFMGYNAVTTAFSKYAVHVWGMEGGNYAMVLMVAQAAAIASYIPVGALASKIGRKRTIQLGVLMLAASFGSAVFFKSFSGLIFFFFAMAGVGWAFINVNSYPMVVEMGSGSDVGKYTGYYYTFSMLAQVVTPILSGAILEYFGYTWLFPYGAFFVAASFVTLLFVHHGDNRPAPKGRLEAFDSPD